jgi:HlyD family secretion protein
MSDDKQLNTFALELGNHSPEGIDILSSEPSKMISSTLYLLAALILCAFIWSFIGKSDVIVVAEGKITPDSKIKRVYAPLNGELIDIYINEGMPVKKNDVIARVRATKAIQRADSYLNAKLSLESKKGDLRRFLAKKELMEKKAESMKQRYLTQKGILERRSKTSLSQIADDHKLSVENQRIEIQKSALELKQAQNAKGKFERLHSLPSKGGVSKKQVNEKITAYKKARVNYTLAKNKIGELETKFNKAYNKEKETQLQGEIQVVDSLIEYENEIESIKKEEAGLKDGMLTAKLLVESTMQVTPKNIDEDGFLKILSPYSGIITEIAYNQPGDKVQSKTPLAGIVPTDSKTILEIEIPEAKRALLKEGQAAKLKVGAFAYQRYGFIAGKLEYISPTTRISPRTKKSYYKGHVSLETTVFTNNGIQYPLRYGMSAIAEIIVRQRRIIDFVLDPIRGIND